MTWYQDTKPGNQVWVDITLSLDGNTAAVVTDGGYVYVLRVILTAPPTSAPTPAPTMAPLVIPSSTLNFTTIYDRGQKPWTSIACSDNGSFMVVVDDGGLIYTSSDYGLTWVAQPQTGNQSWTGVASSANGTHLVAVNSDGLVYTSTDSGLTWTVQPNAPVTNYTSVAITGDGLTIVVVADNDEVYTSKDGGLTWSNTTSPAGNQNWSYVDVSSNGLMQIACVEVRG